MDQEQRNDGSDLDNAGLVLIDLPDVAPVRPPRSLWGAFILAAFTGLTALGFGVAAVQPRITDRAQDRSPMAASADPSTADEPTGDPVVAVARGLARGGSTQVLVSGAARSDIATVDVTVAVGGDRIAGSVLLGDGTRDEVADQPWSAIVDIPPGPVPSDAVATVTLRWMTRQGDTGTSALVVALGDGRGRR